MSDKKTLIFLDYFDSLDKAVRKIKSLIHNRQPDFKVVSSNVDTSPIKELGVDVVYFDELLSVKDYEFMDAYIFDFARKWYLNLRAKDGFDSCKGIRLGSLVEEKTQRIFTMLIKKIEILLKAIDKFHPDNIIFISSSSIFARFPLFVKEEFDISGSFVRIDNDVNLLKDIIAQLRRFVSDTTANILDFILRGIFLTSRVKNCLLIDSRLYGQLKNSLDKGLSPYMYLIEKGIRARYNLLKREKAPFIPLIPETRALGFDIAGLFFRYLYFSRSKKELKKHFNYRGHSIWGISENYIKKIIIDDFGRIRKNICFLTNLYNKIKPRIIVLREAVRELEKTITLSARNCNIPNLVIQHGLLAERGVYTKIHSDKIALWGESGTDWYGRYGSDTNKCVITGKFQHDALYKRFYDRPPQKDILLKLGAQMDKKTIVYIGNFFKDLDEQLNVYYFKDSEFVSIGYVLKAIEYLTDTQLIIKMHPFDLAGRDYISARYPNVFVVKDVDILELISLSSLVITSLFSSAALDAVILNKPVIALNLYKTDDLVPFVKEGAALGAKNFNELFEAIKNIFSSEHAKASLASSRRAFISRHAYRIDGNSTKRVVDLIKGIYHGSSNGGL
ncbi:MAG: CDP-glycerol glycerophosphotransferase family protein [Candidatus Omnitrophota bacterium]|nr:CDP-glycerol glycerophosphotransferase family protein [Candidatus Omnitrophota bacterium]